MYFQDEIWDTGGDGRITITGDIYSTADPLSIYVGTVPTKAVEFFAGGVNVIGELQIDGVPFTGSTLTEDLIPGIFGENAAPGTFTFADGLAITKASGTALSVETGLAGFSYASDGTTNAQLNLGLLIGSSLVLEVTEDLFTVTLSGAAPVIRFGNPTEFNDVLIIKGAVTDPGVAGVLSLSATTATTVGASGAASALPANPLGYLRAYIGTTPIKIPYYNN